MIGKCVDYEVGVRPKGRSNTSGRQVLVKITAGTSNDMKKMWMAVIAWACMSI